MTNAVQQVLGDVWLDKVKVDEGIDKTITAMEDVIKQSDVRKG
jgi:hypothetical protein